MALTIARLEAGKDGWRLAANPNVSTAWLRRGLGDRGRLARRRRRGQCKWYIKYEPQLKSRQMSSASQLGRCLAYLGSQVEGRTGTWRGYPVGSPAPALASSPRTYAMMGKMADRYRRG
jgi:hypothetical protein